MTIKINNRSIFYAICSIWESLNYKFRYQVNQLVTANSDDEHIQDLDIDVQTFAQIMRAVNNQPQGIAKDINKELYDSLVMQIGALAQTGDSEAATIIEMMQGILISNAEILEKQIKIGKQQILQ